MNADLAITNLECPITVVNVPIEKTGPNLRAAPRSLDFLKNAGFDLVTLANNHIMDHGKVGLQDTIQHLQSRDISYVGAAMNYDTASIPFMKNDPGISIAVINVAENEWSTTDGDFPGANPIDPVKVFKQILDAKEKVDKVILITHGGHEHYSLPSPRMKEWFRAFVDMGADAVINHHTHCVSGYEVYKEAPIFYSLGNFLFDHPGKRKDRWNIGSMVELDISRNAVNVEIRYFTQCEGAATAEFMNEEAGNAFLKYIEELNVTISNETKLATEFADWVTSRRKLYNAYLEPIKSRLIQGLQNRGWFPSLWNTRKRAYLLNLVRCESHREAVLQILESELRLKRKKAK
jgi:poly-gamma-glutamate synthesis protein (capsule biosynthesis protein)